MAKVKKVKVDNGNNLRFPVNFKYVLLISMALVIVSIFISLSLGSKNISISNVFKIIFNPQNDVNVIEQSIIRKRISRTVFSLLAGSALGISGALMQSVTRNPIADPSILGVNTGASLFIVFGISFFGLSTIGQYIGFALAGGIFAAIFVYGIGSMGSGGATPLKLALSGVSVSAALSSITSALLIPNANVMDEYRFWQVGSVGGVGWDGVFKFLPFFVVGLTISVLSSSALNAMSLGDEVATSLGVKVGLLRISASFASVILCATVTAFAGPISFIGLISPHIIRLLLGADQRIVIPMSAITGAIILTVSDVIGRVIGSPGEVEAGIITAFVGGPILIILAAKSKVRSI